jgi:hypothetical protein
MEIFIRQGDVVIEKSELPVDFSSFETKRNHVIAGGSSGHTHTVMGTVQVNGSLMIVSKPVIVKHAGQHKPVTLPPGTYTIRILRERGDARDRSVED